MIRQVSNDVTITVMDNAKIIALGNKNQFINIKAADTYWTGIKYSSSLISEFKFVVFSGIKGLNRWGSSGNYLLSSSNFEFTDCIFTDNKVTTFFNYGFPKIFLRNNVVDNFLSMYTTSTSLSGVFDGINWIESNYFNSL